MNNRGYFYCGFYPNQKKNGMFKIGETTVAPSSRQASISKSAKKEFAIIRYISIPNATKEELLLVEAVVRYRLANSGIAQYIAEKNDHFSYSGADKQTVLKITDFCIQCAETVLRNELRSTNYRVCDTLNYIRYF